MTRSEAVLSTPDADDPDSVTDDDAESAGGIDGGTNDGPDADRLTGDSRTTLSAAERRDALRGLADHGGSVAVEETRRALRKLDDGTGVQPETRRVLTTMAVRLSMRLLRRPAAAVEGGDDHVTETVTELFDPAE
ncbi:hypothetical protein [Salinigranum sp. GCM10025319]|uniref:hypothetical protein n=1 Tax=Salinigranum sp. GCM10025319 TaxID=3252687 RepID=UPI003618DD7A